MSNIYNKPYEISLWEDYLNFEVKFLDESGEVIKIENYEDSLADFENPEGYTTEINQYYKERKICVIGSNTMETPLSTFSEKFIRNTNGSSSLTFSMQYKYYDLETKTLLDNPFIKLLVNERKIKLRYGELGAKGTEWYDYIIKNVQENSETKIFNYTAKNLFINELSKSGFNLEFNTELENNQGTIIELGRRVLEGSDWQIPEDFDICLQQTKEEPLYKITLLESITGTNMEDATEQISIEAGKEIYGFYTPIAEELPFFQFLYREDNNYELDEDRNITNSPNYYLDGVSYDEEGKPTFANAQVISNNYRGKRLVRQASTAFDSVLDRYIAVYEDAAGAEVYGYVEDEYISPTAVTNFVANSRDFDSTTGWKEGGAKDEAGNVIYPSLQIETLPDIFDIILDDNQIFNTYLAINFNNIQQVICNTGISNFRSYLNGFTEGTKFTYRIKYGVPNVQKDGLAPSTLRIKAKICKYELKDGIYNILDTFFNFDELIGDNSTEFLYCDALCLKSLSYSDMTMSKLGLFLYIDDIAFLNEQIYIEDVQVFEYVLDANDEIVYPDIVPASGVKKHYFYYYKNSGYTKPEEIVYIYEGTTPSKDFKTKFNDETNYQKIRSITASESNRFNLIQDLCELFECWPNFKIEHDEFTGEILLDENYRQRKFVTFHEYIGKDNDVGFRYGINLKAIQRTLESDAIVSKMVVKSNQNEYAIDGSCNIARAEENPCGENFIYDFSYYINQGMLDFDVINNDLYLDINGYIGYYKQLKRLNKDRDKYIIEQAELIVDQSNLEANLQVFTTSVEQAEEQKVEKELEIERLTGFNYSEFMNPPADFSDEQKEKITSWKEDNSAKAICASIARLTNIIARHTKERGRAQEAVDKNLARQEEIEQELKLIKETKLKLDLQFYKKYSRFIQEGSWIEENYIDDNLYYLDAESTLRTSSQPKVTYTINTLELSQIPGYENYIFNVGDKTYMEDTEFFGWILDKEYGLKTPRREIIVVNEITVALSNPEQNQIKVQNYKTQFEDLFQRITATTQSIEYSTGKYNKVTTIVQSDGTIAPNTLQNSMANNSFIISNAKDQSVIWDETGITTTSLTNPNEIVKIVSGGVFLSNDGGTSWNTGISGKGINANYITSGQIDTSIIQIMAGAFPSFRWDSTGLNAYEFELNEDGKTGKNFNFNKFVRFDQYGLYGINGYNNFNPLVPTEEGLTGEDKIWKYSDFALTWKGFQLRNRYGNGYVSIDSDNDFIVSDGKYARIKIGNLGDSNSPIYGISIKNASGAPVMETNSNGELWLKNELYVGTQETSTVKIGYLAEVRENTAVHEVIHAGDSDTEFIVYEDGKMKATGAEFTGTIYATGGQIGNMTINDIQTGVESTKGVKLIANQGITFQIDANNEVSPNNLDFRIVEKNITINSTDDIIWEISPDLEEDNWTTLGQDIEISVPYQSIQFLDNTCFLRVTVQSSEGKEYSDFTTIHRVFDGKHPIILTIASTTGGIYINGEIKAQLRASVYRNGVDITSNYEDQAFVWTKYNKDGTKDLTWQDFGPIIEIDHTEVEQKATFSCELIQE